LCTARWVGGVRELSMRCKGLAFLENSSICGAELLAGQLRSILPCPDIEKLFRGPLSLISKQATLSNALNY